LPVNFPATVPDYRSIRFNRPIGNLKNVEIGLDGVLPKDTFLFNYIKVIKLLAEKKYG